MAGRIVPRGFLLACGLAPLLATAQVAVPDKEAFTREYSVFFGTDPTPSEKEVFSREWSVWVDVGRDAGETISREFSVLVDVPGTPPALTELGIVSSPTGDTLDLDWGSYGPVRIGDVARFDIYLATEPITSLSGRTPFRTVGGDQTSVRLVGLPAFQDSFVVVVPVDGRGNQDGPVKSFGNYVVAKEVMSREWTVYTGAEVASPYREVVTREFSVLFSNPEPPAAITDLKATPSPLGDTVWLAWPGYPLVAVGDVAYYDFFISTSPMTNVAGMTPVLRVPGDAKEHRVDGLTPGVDRYFAVVPVDGQGNRNPSVQYAGAYTVAAEAFSREFTLVMGTEPSPPPPVTEPVALRNGDFEGMSTDNDVYWNRLNNEQRATLGWVGGGNGPSGPAIFRNGSGWNYQGVPSGIQGISIQGDSFIEQSVQIPQPGTYILSWSAASRGGQVNPYQAVV